MPMERPLRSTLSHCQKETQANDPAFLMLKMNLQGTTLRLPVCTELLERLLKSIHPSFALRP